MEPKYHLSSERSNQTLCLSLERGGSAGMGRYMVVTRTGVSMYLGHFNRLGARVFLVCAGDQCAIKSIKFGPGVANQGTSQGPHQGE